MKYLIPTLTFVLGILGHAYTSDWLMGQRLASIEIRLGVVENNLQHLGAFQPLALPLATRP